MTKVLWLDGGHGGKDAGAVSGTLYEKNIVLDIVKRMKAYIEANYEGVVVKLTRDTDVFYELAERVRLANNAKADLFFSVHVNAGGGTGYEDYIHTPLSNSSSTAVMRDKVHAEVVKVLTKHGIKNRGKKKANYYVIAYTNMPAILVETLFIDTAADKAKLENSGIIQEFAEAYAIGAANALGLSKKKAAATIPTQTKPTPAPIPHPKLYRVQVGAYAKQANAETIAKELRNKGFTVIIAQNAGLYNVQVGAYSSKGNADAQVAKLKKSGYSPFVKYS